jgi:hypothetical protein
MRFNKILELYNCSAHDTTHTSANPWLKRDLVVEPTPCIDSDNLPEFHSPSKRRRQTVSCASRSTHNRNKPCRMRGLLNPARPGQNLSPQTEPAPIQASLAPKTRSVTHQAGILDLPNELLSYILISGASNDWFYCLDYELFHAFRDARPHLRRFTLRELMRLYPQMLDHDSTTSPGSGPATPTQDAFSTCKSHLPDAIKNLISRNTWDLTRYDPFHPTQFFNTAIAGCPTALYVKKSRSLPTTSTLRSPLIITCRPSLQRRRQRLNLNRVFTQICGQDSRKFP